MSEQHKTFKRSEHLQLLARTVAHISSRDVNDFKKNDLLIKINCSKMLTYRMALDAVSYLR